MATTFISRFRISGGVNSMKIASWSKKYYEGLTEAQHKANDVWFKNMLKVLKNTGVLAVPNLQKTFNKEGQECKITEGSTPNQSAFELGLPPTDEPTPIR